MTFDNVWDQANWMGRLGTRTGHGRTKLLLTWSSHPLRMLQRKKAVLLWGTRRLVEGKQKGRTMFLDLIKTRELRVTLV